MNRITCIAGILLPLVLWLMPTAWIPLDGLTVIQHRLLAIFLFAVLFWVFEPIPVFATSVLIVLFQLLLVSDKGLLFLRPDAVTETFGTYVPYADLLHTFANPIIMLFMGGFFLAMSATKYRLDVNLARVLLKPCGSNPRIVLLGLMIVTALFSMFMSNTATTAMMLAVLAPVLRELDTSDRGRLAFILSIPFAANVGGIGTPIGTPPNAVAQKYLMGDQAISFGQWMVFAVPFVVVMLVVVWCVLLRLFPCSTESVRLSIESKWMRSREAVLTYVVFAVTVLLWLTGSGVHGLTSDIVAMIPVGVFVATGVITSKDLKDISWDVLWLVAGGIALGVGLGTTGLSQVLVHAIPFDSLPLLLVAIVAGIAALVMSTFMSNTATANLLLPIMVALGVSLPGLIDLGGSQMLVITVAFACSLAMAMPISTPPNALAHATGLIDTRHMALPGAIIGVIGLVATFIMIWLMRWSGFFETAYNASA